MIKQLPFIPKQLFHQDPEQTEGWIDMYMKRALSGFLNPSAIHPALQSVAPKRLDYEMFETHRNLFVRCRLPEHTSPRDVRFTVNKRMVKIDHLQQTEEIDLSSDVDISRSTAKFKDGILEIRMPKLQDSEPYREIEIRY
jgi:HSP20 family molecular chaperone IbpA